MQNHRLKFAIFLILLFTISTAGLHYLAPASADLPIDEIRWVRNYDQAIQMAQKGDKPIITDLYTDWCHWCKLMDQNTFSDPRVVAESVNYVYLKLNAEEDSDGMTLQRRFNVVSFPTILLLDAEGEEIDRIDGYKTAEPFRDSVQEILEGNSSLRTLRRREADDATDLHNLFLLGQKYYSRHQFEEARIRFERIAGQDRSNRQGFTDTALFYKSICMANLGQVDEALDALLSLRSAYPDSEILPDVDLISAQIYLKTDRPSEAKKTLRGFLKRYPKHRKADAVRQLISEI